MKGKTFKREIAFLLLVYLMYLGVIASVEVLKVLVWPFMLFVGAAYGMEWTSKQTDLVKRKAPKDEEK